MEAEKSGIEENVVPLGCPADPNMAGKADVCQGCPGQALCQQSGEIDPDQEMINLRMNAIKHKIIILSGKGGVGKSTVAALLTMALGEQGMKCGICDLDICGPSVPLLFNVDKEQIVNSPYGWQPLKSPFSGIKVISVGSLLPNQDSAVIWRGPRKTGLIKRFLKDTFWGRLDYLIFDTPPGTSDEHLTVIKALKSAKPDGAIIVTTPQDLALATIRKEIGFCRKMNLPILGIVENMSGFCCPCCEKSWDLFVNKGTEALCQEYGLEYLGKLPIDKNLAALLEKDETFSLLSPSGIFEKLREVTKRVEAMLF